MATKKKAQTVPPVKNIGKPGSKDLSGCYEMSGGGSVAAVHFDAQDARNIGTRLIAWAAGRSDDDEERLTIEVEFEPDSGRTILTIEPAD